MNDEWWIEHIKIIIALSTLTLTSFQDASISTLAATTVSNFLEALFISATQLHNTSTF